jgi:predicted nucleic acid-binding protein
VVLLEHDLVIGRNVLRELKKALRGKVKLSESRTAEIVDFVSGEAIQIVQRCDPAIAAGDADDALALGEALAGEARVFATGDAALIELARIEALAIVPPRGFWEILRAPDG